MLFGFAHRSDWSSAATPAAAGRQLWLRVPGIQRWEFKLMHGGNGKAEQG